MTRFVVPSISLASFGCRLVLDEAYEDRDGEISIIESPLVEIPKGYLLVGPPCSRLMLQHSLLMSSSFEHLGKPDDGSPALDPLISGIDLSAQVIHYCGYTSMLCKVKKGSGRALGDEDREFLDELRATQGAWRGHQAGAADRGRLWAGVAGFMLSHGPDFYREAAGGVHLARTCEMPVGILDYRAAEPRLWECRLNESPLINGWKLPPEMLERMTQVLADDYPERLAELVLEPDEPLRDRAAA